MWLAREIVALYHSNDAAPKAEEAFVKTFQKKEAPDEVAEKTVKSKILADVLVEVGFASSKTDARRTIEQGGVKIDGIVAEDPLLAVRPGMLIQKGKRYFVRVNH